MFPVRVSTSTKPIGTTAAGGFVGAEVRVEGFCRQSVRQRPGCPNTQPDSVLQEYCGVPTHCHDIRQRKSLCTNEKSAD
jgi:hypothetical protein